MCALYFNKYNTLYRIREERSINIFLSGAPTCKFLSPLDLSAEKKRRGSVEKTRSLMRTYCLQSSQGSVDLLRLTVLPLLSILLEYH